jgi:hypothetical protein
MSNDDTLEDNVAAERKTRAINAMKEMQEISVSLGNDKMTIEDINVVINDRRTSKWDFGQWLNEQPEPTDDAFFAEIERALAEAMAMGVLDCRE